MNQWEEKIAEEEEGNSWARKLMKRSYPTYL